MTASAFEHPFRATAPRPPAAAAVSEVLGVLALWHRRAETRAALARMPDERLIDLGLTARAAARESAKPFWRA